MGGVDAVDGSVCRPVFGIVLLIYMYRLSTVLVRNRKAGGYEEKVASARLLLLRGPNILLKHTPDRPKVSQKPEVKYSTSIPAIACGPSHAGEGGVSLCLRPICYFTIFLREGL